MIPWITLVVMAGYPSIPHGMLKVVFLKSFHLLDSHCGGAVPLGFHSTELVDSNPPPKFNFSEVDKVLEQRKVAPIARGRTLPLNRSE